MPMHTDDIAADIGRRDRDGVEEAFRALVGWPGENAIVGSTPAQRRGFLTDACRILVETENTRVMPGGTFTLILDEAEDMDGSTYADGARAVLRCDAFFDNLDREGR